MPAWLPGCFVPIRLLSHVLSLLVSLFVLQAKAGMKGERKRRRSHGKKGSL